MIPSELASMTLSVVPTFVAKINLKKTSTLWDIRITPIALPGKAMGVILMSHNVDVFFKFILATKVGTTDNVMLANSDGIILFSPPSGTKELQLDKGLLQDISKELSGWLT